VSLSQIAPQYAGKVQFYLLEYGHDPSAPGSPPKNAQTVKRLGVHAFPTTIIFRDGLMVATIHAVLNQDTLPPWIDGAVQTPADYGLPVPPVVPPVSRPNNLQSVVKNADGACEAWSLPILAGAELLAIKGGTVNVQDMSGVGGGKWSGDRQLFWTPGKPHAKLVLGLPVDADGKYQLTTALTKAASYGIVQLYLDDQKLAEPIDLYNNGVILTPAIDLGTHELTKGQHRLTVEIVGRNEAGAPGGYFGMDWIKLAPVG
jgi:hypothetical protein